MFTSQNPCDSSLGSRDEYSTAPNGSSHRPAYIDTQQTVSIAIYCYSAQKPTLTQGRRLEST